MLVQFEQQGIKLLWEGEKMDYDMAIEELLWLESPPEQTTSAGVE